jgi:serine/threonine protein kinase
VFEDDAAVHLVMELCEGGALLERIESRRYSEAYIARLARSVLRFVSQCHAKGIMCGWTGRLWLVSACFASVEPACCSPELLACPLLVGIQRIHHFPFAFCYALRYRDVKPDNFLFLNREEESPLKATDFGEWLLGIAMVFTNIYLPALQGTLAMDQPEVFDRFLSSTCLKGKTARPGLQSGFCLHRVKYSTLA